MNNFDDLRHTTKIMPQKTTKMVLLLFIYFSPDDLALRTVPSFRNRFRQKKVYRRFWVKDSPVIQKTFSPKKGIPLS